jgi:type I restriction enzyme, S subunit
MTKTTACLAKATLSELCTLVTDGTHDTPKRVETGFPLIKAKEIVGGRIDFDTCDQISREDHLQVIARSKPEKGDTLFAHIGASLGEAAYVNTERPFSIKNIALFKPDPSKVNCRYLYYLVISPEFQALAKAARTGSAQPFLSLGHLRAHPLRYHKDLREQERIAAILTAYDDLIEVNWQRIELLERIAQRLFEEWFVRFRFPGHEAQAMVKAAKGSLPEGWKSGVLGDLVELRRDKTSPGEHLSARVYVPIECIGRKTLALSEIKPWDEAQSSLQLFERDGILFGAMRAYFHKVAPAPMAGITRSTCFVLRARSSSLFAFATLALFRDETVAFAAANSKGSTIPYAQWAGSLERMPIAIPKLELLRRFDALVRPMLAMIMNSFEVNRQLAASRDLVLPRLISGEVSLSSAERELEAVA